jgi:hypothetical protein
MEGVGRQRVKRRKWCITEEGKGETDFVYDPLFIFDDFCPAAFCIAYEVLFHE